MADMHMGCAHEGTQRKDAIEAHYNACFCNWPRTHFTRSLRSRKDEANYSSYNLTPHCLCQYSKSIRILAYALRFTALTSMRCLYFFHFFKEQTALVRNQMSGLNDAYHAILES
jgi:hypothetical protein